MNLNTADALAAFIKSVRAKALEDVINLIKSDAVLKDENGWIMIYESELSKLIMEIDSNKLKKQRAALKDKGQAVDDMLTDLTFDEIRDP
jgi:hypothetical protein